MANDLSAMDRLRIERVVWSLDQRLYDLPRASRIAKRREVRENVRTAALDIGTTAALKNLGDPRRLAMEYRDAEFGDDPRPSWWAAAIFLLTAQLIVTSVLSEAALAFRDGILTANPDVSGTFVWSGIHYLQASVTYTFVHGQGDFVGGAWTPLAWAIWIVATVLIGRLWRVVPWWRRRRAGAVAR